MSVGSAIVAAILASLASVATAAPDESSRDSWVDKLALATAREYYAQGRLEDAERQLGTLAKHKSLDADGLVLAGDILRERGDWPRAEAAFRAAISAEPGRADLHLRLGQALQEQNKTAAADAEFSRYSELARGSRP